MSASRVVADARALDLDRHRLAAVQDGAVDLADRGGGERLVAERPEDRLGIGAELLADDRADLVVRERRDLVEELEQLVAVGGRQQVEAQGQHLAQLDPGAAQALEGQAQPDRARCADRHRAGGGPGR